MVELRWLVSTRSENERVLQYRQQEKPYTLGDVTYQKWTEWQNIPEVSMSPDTTRDDSK